MKFIYGTFKRESCYALQSMLNGTVLDDTRVRANTNFLFHNDSIIGIMYWEVIFKNP
jgi:hypothetical protein